MASEASPMGSWPSLPYSEWRDTAETLHLWTQVVGKVRTALSPWINHSWHVTLYVTPRGMTTGSIPHGSRTFSIDFDFIEHQLVIRTCAGLYRRQADFHLVLVGDVGDLFAREMMVHVPRAGAVPPDPDRRADHSAEQIGASGDLHVQQHIEAAAAQRQAQRFHGRPAAFLVEHDELDVIHAGEQPVLELADDPGDACFGPLLPQGANDRQGVGRVAERRQAEYADTFRRVEQFDHGTSPPYGCVIDVDAGRPQNTLA